MAHMWVIALVNVVAFTHLDLNVLHVTLNLLITFIANSLNSTIPYHFANAWKSYVTTTTNVCEMRNCPIPLYSTSLTIITSIHSKSMEHKLILVITLHV